MTIALTIFIFIGLEYYQYQKVFNAQKERIGLTISAKLDEINQEIKGEINNVILAFNLGLQSIYGMQSSPKLLSLSLNACKKELKLKTVFFVNNKGEIIFPGLSSKILSLSQFSQKETFLKYLTLAQETRKSVFYLMYLPFFHKTQERWVKKPFLSIIVPVFLPHSKQFLGAGVGVLDLEHVIGNRLKQTLPLEKIRLFVIDNENRILWASQKEFTYQNLNFILNPLPLHYRLQILNLLDTLQEGKLRKKGIIVNWPMSSSQIGRFLFIASRMAILNHANWLFICLYPTSLIQKHFLSTYKANFFLSAVIILCLNGILFASNQFYHKTCNLLSRHRQALQSLIDPFVITDIDGKCLYFNPAFEHLIGKVKIGQRLCRMAPEWGSGKMPFWHKKMLTAVRQGRTYELLRYKFKTLTGEPFYARVTFSPIKNEEDKPTYVAIDFSNITQQVKLEEKLKRYNERLEDIVEERTQALKERERQYRQIFENRLVGIFIIRSDAHFLMYNQTFRKMTQYTDAELQKLSLKEMCSPTEKAALDKILKDCLQKGNVFYQECKFFPKTQKTLFVDLFLQVTQFKGEKAVLGFIYDVTQRKVLEDKLREQDRIAVLGEMAAGVAHDINNMLMVVMGNLELSKYLLDSNAGRARGYLQKAIETIQDGEAIVRRLYAYAHRKLQAVEVIDNLNQLVHETIELTQPLWKAKAHREGKEIVIKEDFGKLGPIAGNRAELKEVFVNIIKNAVEAMPRGGRITIKTWQESKKNCVMIKDMGCGIPEVMKKKIFEPFFTTKGEKGTGLGLAVSLGVIRAHGGEIKVESQEGKGTTFYIYLPIVEPELISAGEQPSEGLELKIKKKVLVVDDEQEILEVISEMLRALGIRVVTTSSPLKALEIFERYQEELGLIITDLGMPEMSGFELTKRIKQLAPSMPVVLLTGWGASVTPLEIKQNKIDYVVAKPVTIENLRQILLALVQSSKFKV